MQEYPLMKNAWLTKAFIVMALGLELLLPLGGWELSRCYAEAQNPVTISTPAQQNQSPTLFPARISCGHTLDGQILLPVRLTGANGKTVDANFTLDTGFTSCCITDTMAERLGLKSRAMIGEDGRPIMFAGAAANLARLPRMQIGPLHQKDLDYLILHTKALSGISRRPSDGIIGSNFLSVLPALIDFQRNEVTFFEPGPVTSDTLRAVGATNESAILLKNLENNYSYACSAQIVSDGKSIQRDLVIDTGSDETTINGSDARALGFSTQDEPPLNVMLLAGPTKMYEAKTTKITLGDGGTVTQVQDSAVEYTKENLPGFLPPHLGRNVLARYRILLDFPENRIYFLPGVPQFGIRIGSPPTPQL